MRADLRAILLLPDLRRQDHLSYIVQTLNPLSLRISQVIRVRHLRIEHNLSQNSADVVVRRVLHSLVEDIILRLRSSRRIASSLQLVLALLLKRFSHLDLPRPEYQLFVGGILQFFELIFSQNILNHVQRHLFE